ncbi:nuclear transport factor 2 family protein [Sansalvadorimonas sp. 2012CJ34-2]|uniref:Nuclear transport factor 2 family protein n=1 Tax=Parendozoicomonas callyspongiae TaxID=2942213 RepID=A0ABT0PJM2_9GAMM|nr:nuclear transport factor 2 family protein [Sansalvadorimonas sp. 2012CJ34-2]MCL6271592.1 nuclear transport factor 2 family protein [Sansalvadorimonas sp. 2012CJ34-2]
MIPSVIEKWHNIIATKNPSTLGDILADDVFFYSPVVHTPQKGKQLTRMYLMGASHVLLSGPFRYEREVIGDGFAVLEFTTEIDGIQINGVDMISWNEDNLITEFKVMLRPLKAINLVHQKMGEMLKLVQSGKMSIPA